jgi:hypothetical protein
MSEITLTTPIELVPAVEAKTTTTVKVVSISENYGWDYDAGQPGRNYPGLGNPQSVEAVILLDLETGFQRTVTVWQGEEYLAVRGTWTDADLNAKILSILNPAT